MIAALDELKTIWLMGTKTRLIRDFIGGAIADLLPPGKALLDLCSGSAAVARAAAPSHRVVANDVQRFASVIASAHLEGDASWGEALERLDPEADLAGACAENFRALTRLLPEALAAEDELLPRLISELSAGAPGGATESYRRLQAATPDVDHPTGDGSSLFAPLNGAYEAELAKRRGNPQEMPFALVTLYYANVYFGLNQALAIDSLRAAIAMLPKDDPHHLRKTNLYLAALLYAASVSTSGTSHFAQPRSLGRNPELLAVARRRTIDIAGQFYRAVDEIRGEWLNRPRIDGEHRVYRMAVDELLSNENAMAAENIGLVYFDPPYTADNYSRFYHLLETLVTYEYPELERVRGKLTRGRYPLLQHRFQSSFCKASQVEDAFRRVIAGARSLGANLLVSYSDESGLLLRHWRSRKEENALQQFRELFRESYPNVEIRKRSLLHSGQGDSNRTVQELLVLCEL